MSSRRVYSSRTAKRNRSISPGISPRLSKEKSSKNARAFAATNDEGQRRRLSAQPIMWPSEGRADAIYINVASVISEVRPFGQLTRHCSMPKTRDVECGLSPISAALEIKSLRGSSIGERDYRRRVRSFVRSRKLPYAHRIFGGRARPRDHQTSWHVSFLPASTIRRHLRRQRITNRRIGLTSIFLRTRYTPHRYLINTRNCINESGR